MWHQISSLYYVLHRRHHWINVISNPDNNNTHSIECNRNYVQYWEVDSWAKHSSVYRFEVWNSFSGESCLLMINSKQTFRRDGVSPCSRSCTVSSCWSSFTSLSLLIWKRSISLHAYWNMLTCIWAWTIFYWKKDLCKFKDCKDWESVRALDKL